MSHDVVDWILTLLALVSIAGVLVYLGAKINALWVGYRRRKAYRETLEEKAGGRKL